MKPFSSPSSSTRWIAFSLSAFLLPGLGQLHLGFRKKGWGMILLSFATAIFTFGKFMMGVFKAMDRMHYARPPRLDVVKILFEAFQIERGWVIGGLSLLLLVWIWAMWDVMIKTRYEGSSRLSQGN